MIALQGTAPADKFSYRLFQSQLHADVPSLQGLPSVLWPAERRHLAAD